MRKNLKKANQKAGITKQQMSNKFIIAYHNANKCEFHNIGTYIVATSVIGGIAFCAFFDSELHTEESIRHKGSIKMHSVYPIGLSRAPRGRNRTGKE